MSELDLDAIEARANAGVRQTTADADVLALVARVRELEAEAREDEGVIKALRRQRDTAEQKIIYVREVLDAEEEVVEAAAIDYGAMLPRTVMIDDILDALEDPS